MNDRAQATWNDERRWDYAHAILSLEAVAPLYAYIGIPFQGEVAASFQKLLRSYVSEVYLRPPVGPVLGLDDKQGRLARAIDNEYNAEWRAQYISWLVHVFVYLPGEHTAGWTEWRTIFMRCSVRAEWWPALQLPPDKDARIRLELSDTKTRMDDARDLVNSWSATEASEWDRYVLSYLKIDEDALESGEPFNRILLTTTFFLFYLFWNELMKLLSPEEAARLWKSGKELAPHLDIRPEDLADLRSLQITPP